MFIIEDVEIKPTHPNKETLEEATCVLTTNKGVYEVQTKWKGFYPALGCKVIYSPHYEDDKPEDYKQYVQSAIEVAQSEVTSYCENTYKPYQPEKLTVREEVINKGHLLHTVVQHMETKQFHYVTTRYFGNLVDTYEVTRGVPLEYVLAWVKRSLIRGRFV